MARMRPDDKEQGSNENEENEEPMSSSLSSEREECFGPAAETKSPRRLLPIKFPAAVRRRALPIRVIRALRGSSWAEINKRDACATSARGRRGFFRSGDRQVTDAA